MIIASVIIDGRTRQVDKAFSYRVPQSLAAEVEVGVRVRVPFGGGNRHEVAYVIKVENKAWTEEIKDVQEVLDAAPLFDRQKLLEAYWIKNRYFSTFSEAIKLFLPPGSSAKLTEWIRLTGKVIDPDNTEKQIADIVTENGEVCAFDVLKETLGDKARSGVNSLLRKGAIEISHTTEKKGPTEKCARDSFCKRAGKETLGCRKTRSKHYARMRVLVDGGFMSFRILRKLDCPNTFEKRRFKGRKRRGSSFADGARSVGNTKKYYVKRRTAFGDKSNFGCARNPFKTNAFAWCYGKRKNGSLSCGNRKDTKRREKCDCACT